MKRSTCSIAALLVFITALAAGFVVAESEPATVDVSFGVEVKFNIDNQNGTFLATATVIDLATGNTITAPRITGKLGTEAITRSGIQSVGGSNEAKITFYADKETTKYNLEILNNGQVVTSLSSSVTR